MKVTLGTRGLFVVMTMVYILILMVVTYLCTFVKTHQTGVKMAEIPKAVEENNTTDKPANDLQ